MGGRPLEGPTMVGRTLDWNDELGRWLKPFVDRLGHRARRRMCPLYVSGLIGPGDRKSVHGSQGAATHVPALRVGTDRPWRSQERSADGEAACGSAIGEILRIVVVRLGGA